MYDSTAQRVYLKISASNFKRSEIMPVCAASNARPRIRLITHGERILPGICSDRSIRYTWTPAIERTNKTINSLLSLKYYHSHVGCTWNHNIFVFFFRTYLFHNLTVSTVATEAQTAAYSNYLPAIVCDAEFALVWHSFFFFFFVIRSGKFNQNQSSTLKIWTEQGVACLLSVWWPISLWFDFECRFRLYILYRKMAVGVCGRNHACNTDAVFLGLCAREDGLTRTYTTRLLILVYSAVYTQMSWKYCLIDTFWGVRRSWETHMSD